MKRLIAIVLVIATLFTIMTVPVSAASSCNHSRKRTKTYDTEYIENNSSTHTRIRYRKEICKSCNKTLYCWPEDDEQKHDFEYGICEDCGYELTIEELLEEENIIVWKNESKTVYVKGEKARWDYASTAFEDIIMVPLTTAVETLGGEFYFWDFDTSSAYVGLNGKTVEFKKNTTKYWIDGKRKFANVRARIIDEKLYVELEVLLKIARQDVKYENDYIIISDDDLTSKQVKKIIDYLYNGKEEEIDLTDIEAGKVYATSTDGKHIYKRTYDVSKSCKYTDVYECTVFNIDLPKGVVLIQEGNYLYSNGQKVFANVDILQQVDTRITQLNRIIDGANNAYDNDVISKSRRNRIRNDAKDVIEEYEEVAKGEKTLSKVSEVKQSYKAKVGDSNSTIKKIQQKLYDFGYTSQLVTGYYEDITFNNVAYFQIVNGLDVTGWVDSDTYDTLFYEEETTFFEPENTVPYAYPTNLYEGMKVKKGWFELNIEGNEYCDEITLHMYSYTRFNNGFSERKRISGDSGTVEFDCTDVGDYTLIVESRNNNTGQLFEYEINFTVVDTTTNTELFAYFMLGMWDGVVETGKGVWSVVSHPIQSGKSFVSGTVFIAKAIITDGEERDTLYYIWTTTGMEMLADLEDDEAKDTARKLGKFTAEILLVVIAEKGITKATTALKESAKSGKLSKVSNAWVKTKEKADDFLKGLLSNKVLSKFSVIKNKFPNEALPSDGKIYPSIVENGKIIGPSGLKEADFVIKTNGEIVIGFRHAFLANGEDVLAAGHLIFDGKGKVKLITNKSGHYRPTVDEAMQFEDVFKELGIDLSNTKINYYTFVTDNDGDIIESILTVNQKIIE